MYWSVKAEGPTNLVGVKPANAISGADGELEMVAANRKISHPRCWPSCAPAAVTEIEVAQSDFEGAIFASDVVDLTTGELLYEANQEATADKLHKILQTGIDGLSRSSSLRRTTSATSSPTR